MTPPVPLAPVEVLERGRRGEPVDAASVEAFARSWLGGDTSDAMMAAWCMCACLRGMQPGHPEALARALVASGERLELASLGAAGDIGTTGAVGDTVPLVAAPLAASLGVLVATMGGRGVGHVGGIVDKLESIAGFEAEMSLGAFVRQARDVGIVVAAPIDRLVPGDRRLEALRDATGTLPAAGLVAASEMVTRVACGAGAISLLVGCGEGGPLATREEADAAAAAMAAMGEAWGRRVRWTVADVEAPLGRAVGNALEVAEAAAVLRGAGPDDVRQLAVRMAGDLAEAAGVLDAGTGREAAAEALADGSALATAERWVEAQGGDPEVWTDPGALPVAPLRVDVEAPRAGVVARVGARALGETARWLGAGRLHAMQAIDPVAGLEVLVRVGDVVEEGQPLAVIHAREDGAGARARAMAEAAFVIGDDPVEARPVVLGEGTAGA
ncbi:MAG: thymidine phosphorylase [Thermoleophilia bacterium]